MAIVHLYGPLYDGYEPDDADSYGAEARPVVDGMAWDGAGDHDAEPVAEPEPVPWPGLRRLGMERKERERQERSWRTGNPSADASFSRMMASLYLNRAARAALEGGGAE